MCHISYTYLSAYFACYTEELQMVMQAGSLYWTNTTIRQSPSFLHNNHEQLASLPTRTKEINTPKQLSPPKFRTVSYPQLQVLVVQWNDYSNQIYTSHGSFSCQLVQVVVSTLYIWLIWPNPIAVIFFSGKKKNTHKHQNCTSPSWSV